MNVLETLQAELAELQEKLATLERYKAEKSSLTGQISRVKGAIDQLTKPVGVRKPMSPEGKAAIRAGLEKARAAKAANAAPTAEPAPKAESQRSKLFGRG